MSHTHDLFCTDGCGTKLGSVTLEDGMEFKGNDHYGLMVPDHAKAKAAQIEADRLALEKAEFDAKVAEAVDAQLARKGL